MYFWVSKLLQELFILFFNIKKSQIPIILNLYYYNSSESFLFLLSLKCILSPSGLLSETLVLTFMKNWKILQHMPLMVAMISIPSPSAVTMSCVFKGLKIEWYREVPV